MFPNFYIDKIDWLKHIEKRRKRVLGKQTESFWFQFVFLYNIFYLVKLQKNFKDNWNEFVKVHKVRSVVYSEVRKVIGCGHRKVVIKNSATQKSILFLFNPRFLIKSNIYKKYKKCWDAFFFTPQHLL